MKNLLLLAIGVGISSANHAEKPISAIGKQLDPDGDNWWIDSHNELSFQNRNPNLLSACDSQTYETRFRYYNNAGQVYVRMTADWIFAEFWHPDQFSTGFETTAQILGDKPNQCYQCLADAAFSNPEEYDFIAERKNSPNKNCWSACIENNEFLNDGQSGHQWKLFDGEVKNNLVSESSESSSTFNSTMEIVKVTDASIYNYQTGNLANLGSFEVNYVHGSWFRRYANKNGNKWLSPLYYQPAVPNPFGRSLESDSCFTWIASTTEKKNGENEVNKCGITCPEIRKCTNEEVGIVNDKELTMKRSTNNLRGQMKWGDWGTKNPTQSPTWWWQTTKKPTSPPTPHPIWWWTQQPTTTTTRRPTYHPTRRPTYPPTRRPTTTRPPTKRPTYPPTRRPTTTRHPTYHPTRRPTYPPTRRPTYPPTRRPTTKPPTKRPTYHPTEYPTHAPTYPSQHPTTSPTYHPTKTPTEYPTHAPTYPSQHPTQTPTYHPTKTPTEYPTHAPTYPSQHPTQTPTHHPTKTPTEYPTHAPTYPSQHPTTTPTHHPTKTPTYHPTKTPTYHPTTSPTYHPTTSPTYHPTNSPTYHPTKTPTYHPTTSPTYHPTKTPTYHPTTTPTYHPTKTPTYHPTTTPTYHPTTSPTYHPTKTPTYHPTTSPTYHPTKTPTYHPTTSPTYHPTKTPTYHPTHTPTYHPTHTPTYHPTTSPTYHPTTTPTYHPTTSPTYHPTKTPTYHPTTSPTYHPTPSPTYHPTTTPTYHPTESPTPTPTIFSTMHPTQSPTVCTPPPPHIVTPECSCKPECAEWKLDLMDFKYDEHKDRTYVQYEVCVYARSPACSHTPWPEALDKLFLQIPCNCDLCIDFATKEMEPHGFTSELDRGWIWEVKVEPGECQYFELALKGHTTLKTGNYQLFGCDDRCVSDTIMVPDICEKVPSTQWWTKETDSSSSSSSSSESNEDKCDNLEPLFLKNMCFDACDYLEETEWNIQSIPATYDAVLDQTTFSWVVSTSANLPSPSCNVLSDIPSPLTDVTIRMGCDCELQSDRYLQSITVETIPSAAVKDNYWHFEFLDVTAGHSQILKIVLKGNMASADNGDVTLGGGYRCGSTLTTKSPLSVTVPNPCHNHCNFGQWTDWQTIGDCSVDCGGGEQARVRTCVSVCNDETPVENCPGRDHGFAPCNTQPCPVWFSDSSSSSSSSSSDSSSN